MSNERLIKMLSLLLQRTNEQKLVWEQSVDDDLYQVAFQNYTVQIGYRSSSQRFGDMDYFIRISDENNKTVEEATDVDLQNDLEDSYKIMADLYVKARRQAMEVDKAIDSILSSLENDN